MPSERVQRQIDRFLDEAEEAARLDDWAKVRQRALAVLDLDPGNEDATTVLQAADRAQIRLGQSTSAASPTGSTTAENAPETQPTSFANGRYEVRRFLGEGGKKRVYLAHDVTLDRDVAFALIKTEGLDDAGRQRITREAQAMGRLGSHPNIVSVFDLGTEGDQPFLVAELMGGGDVEGLIEKAEGHKLALDRAIQIAIETCHGLVFAHEKGIIHRDLKPGNVWLTATGTAKIGDFGLAVAIDRSRLTQAGMMVGTVSYMPPEQAMGGAVGPQSDLYSLGAMLYEMVCGRPPFVGDESVAIIGQHLNTPAVAPTWHRHDCPPALEALILRLLEKDPAKRPASAAEVAAMLATIDPAGALARPASTTTQVAVAEDPLYRTTFVGRESEVKTLQGALDAALSGNGGLVMVAGEPGIGKTALCEQLITYAGLRGAKALVGHCYEEGSLSLPYLAFVEAIRSYVLAREPDGLRSDMGSGASEIARIVTEVRDRVSVDVRPAGDPEDDRWRLLQAVSSFLRNASTVQPIVVLLEDLHWADRGTLDLLLHVARNLQGARLLIVGNYRDVEVDRAHPLANVLADLRRILGFQRIPLRGLTVDEVARMMTNIRGQESNYARAEAIHRQTEGNPLFIQEVLRYLVEEGLTVRQDGRYVGNYGDDPNAGIPEGLREVVGKRLSHLSEKSNQVLTIAAVIGRDFRLDILEKVAGLSEEDLYAALEEASGRAIIEQRQSPGGLAFRFTHAFFRQTLYEEIFVPRRIRVHQQVGKALEEVYGTRLDDHAAELAEHYAQSTETADLEKAVRYSELAAERSMAVFAYGEAVRLLEQALRAQEVLDPEDHAKRCDLLLIMADALIPSGDPKRAADFGLEEAFSLAKGLEDKGRAAEACRLALVALGVHAGASATLMPSYRRWADRGDSCSLIGTRQRIRTDLALAQLSNFDGDLLTSIELRSRALSTARSLNDRSSMFQAALFMFSGANFPENLRALKDLANEVVSWPREGVNAGTLAPALENSARTLLAWGQRLDAEEVWRELDELAKRTRNPTALLYSLMGSAIVAQVDGRLVACLEQASQMVELGADLGILPLARRFAELLTRRTLLQLGRNTEALSTVELLIAASVDPLSDDGREGLALSSRRLVSLSRLRNADALAELNDVMTQIEGLSLAKVGTDILLNLLEAAIVVGSQNVIARIAPVLSPASGILNPFSLVSPARLLGAASALLGSPNGAREYYSQSLEVCTKIRFRPEIALTRLSLAELLLDHYPDEHATAIEHLDFAIAEFREMKMQPSLERALSHRGLLKA